MSAPSHDDDQLKLEIFDSFSKTVMRNASRNFAAAAKTRRKNESVNTAVSLQQNGCIRQCCCCRPNKRKWLFWNSGMECLFPRFPKHCGSPDAPCQNGRKTHLQIFAVITKGHKSMKLDYETVYRAVKGDHDAQEKLLQYYDAYISALSTVVEICSDGTEHQYVCEDQKAEIHTNDTEALSKCKVIK